MHEVSRNEASAGGTATSQRCIGIDPGAGGDKKSWQVPQSEDVKHACGKSESCKYAQDKNSDSDGEAFAGASFTEETFGVILLADRLLSEEVMCLIFHILLLNI